MEYRNCTIVFTDGGTACDYAIYFGSSLVYAGSAPDQAAAQSVAILWIDDFITTLPPALSYQN